MEPAPANGSPAPAGDRARPSTVKVIEISVALCLKGMGLRAEAWSSTKDKTPNLMEAAMYSDSVPPDGCWFDQTDAREDA